MKDFTLLHKSFLTGCHFPVYNYSKQDTPDHQGRYFILMAVVFFIFADSLNDFHLLPRDLSQVLPATARNNYSEVNCTVSNSLLLSANAFQDVIAGGNQLLFNTYGIPDLVSSTTLPESWSALSNPTWSSPNCSLLNSLSNNLVSNALISSETSALVSSASTSSGSILSSASSSSLRLQPSRLATDISDLLFDNGPFYQGSHTQTTHYSQTLVNDSTPTSMPHTSNHEEGHGQTNELSESNIASGQDFVLNLSTSPAQTVPPLIATSTIETTSSIDQSKTWPLSRVVQESVGSYSSTQQSTSSIGQQKRASSEVEADSSAASLVKKRRHESMCHY